MFTGILPDFKIYKTLPNISTFAESQQFCGKTCYPKQRTFLKLMFLEDENFTDYDMAVIGEWMSNGKRGVGDAMLPEDIFERIKINKSNGRTHFKEVIDVGGRRGGKGFNGGIIGGYGVLKMVSLDDPQKYYGLDRSKDLYINVVATSLLQAKRYLFADIATTILGCRALAPYLLKAQEEEIRVQTPYDMRRKAILKKTGVKIDKDIASIRVIANSADGKGGRGGAAFFQAFDEFAHTIEGDSTKSSSEIYEAFTPSQAQMGKDGMTYIPSSPYCLEPSTLVLNNKFEYVPVGSLSVGDKLIAFDEHGTRHWRESIVEHAEVIKAPRKEIIFESGRSFKCTPEHLWLVGDKWVATKNLLVGDSVRTIKDDTVARGTKYLSKLINIGGMVSRANTSFDRIINIRNATHGDVVALQTSTSTIIADGCLSHNTKVGKFFELYNQGLESDDYGDPKFPEILVIQHASWSMYEDWEHDKRFTRPIIAYDDELKQKELRNPEKFKVEYRAQFAETIDAFLAPEMVDRAFNNDLQLQEHGDINTKYVFHADPGKSQDAYCVAGGHKYLGDDGYYHVNIDFMKAYQARDFTPDPNTGVPWVDYNFVSEDLRKISRMFNIESFTFDQFNSTQSIQTLQAAVTAGQTMNRNQNVGEFTFTAKSTRNIFDVFKTAVYMGLVHIPEYVIDYPGAGRINLPMEEMKFLQYKNKRVDHQCHDSETLVLTRLGWKPFSDVTIYDFVATQQEGRIFFRQPHKVINEHYDGPLYYYSDDYLDFAVTPNHRMVHKDGITEIEELMDGNFQVPQYLDLWREVDVSKIEVKHYSGNIGCVDIGGAKIITRRNQKTLVSGNSSGAIKSKDMVDCIATIVYQLLVEQMDAIENGTFRIVGAAQGGYNAQEFDVLPPINQGFGNSYGRLGASRSGVTRGWR